MFHSIFSKKQNREKEQKQKSKIIIDNREKNALVASELAKLGFQIKFEQLEIADYIIGDIAIERKTISDLKSSIINKRIFSQMREIKQYEKYLLIIEGADECMFNNKIIHENAMRGFIIAAALEYKLPIIFTKDEKNTAFYLSILANKKESSKISLRPSKIAFSKEEQLQYILEGFPNIGPVKSKALLEKFKSLKNIINASESELESVLGKRMDEFKSLLE